ncbi:MAG TPA: hypothetical protein VJC18_01560, partial [bacterium]|nr:hypothetical protein [bacterium]
LDNNPVFAGLYSVGDEWDTVAIQEAINAAQPGQAVCVGPGDYKILRAEKRPRNHPFFKYEANIKFKSRLSIIGAGRNHVRFRSGTATGVENGISHDVGSTWDQPIQNVTIEGISFHNLDMRLSVSTNRQDLLHHFTIKDSRFVDSTSSDFFNYEGDTMILARYTGSVIIDNCEFLRDENHIGRGVMFYQAHDGQVINSRFDGFFITFVNVLGSTIVDGEFILSQRSHNITIENNFMKRSSHLDVADQNTFLQTQLAVYNNRVATIASTFAKNGLSYWENHRNTIQNIIDGQVPFSEVRYLEDHGIYAVGFSGLTIRNNRIAGNEFDQGAVKIRNGEIATIEGNTADSPFYFFTYNLAQSVPYYLRQVTISDNELNLLRFENPAQQYLFNEVTGCQGISYWRQGSIPGNIEIDDITITNNTIHNGCIMLRAGAYGPGITVTSNQAMDFIFDVQPIASGNTVISD